MGPRRSPREERAYREEQRRKAIARELKAELQVEQQRKGLEQQQLRLEEQQRLAAQRQAARVERERKALHERRRVAERDARNGELQRRVTELETLLASSLAIAPGTGFAELKRTVDLPPLDPGQDAKSLPIPQWEAFAPAQPSAVGPLFGGTGRYERAVVAAQRQYGKALADRAAAERARLGRLKEAEHAYAQRLAAEQQATTLPMHRQRRRHPEQFSGLVLTDVTPAETLRHLNALVSPHPFDLEAVRPVLEFDLTKYKFIDEIDMLAGLDGRLDLLELSPVEFEHLVRQLWVTQASRDDGVDAVAINPDSIVGGLCIVQAKRYTGVVSTESVWALGGVMDDKRAAKGVMVTTSWYGKESWDFAARHGRIELMDGPRLKHLLKEKRDLDVLISLPRRATKT